MKNSLTSCLKTSSSALHSSVYTASLLETFSWHMIWICQYCKTVFILYQWMCWTSETKTLSPISAFVCSWSNVNANIVCTGFFYLFFFRCTYANISYRCFGSVNCLRVKWILSDMLFPPRGWNDTCTFVFYITYYLNVFLIVLKILFIWYYTGFSKILDF